MLGIYGSIFATIASKLFEWLLIAQSKLPIKILTLRQKLAKLRGKEHPV